MIELQIDANFEEILNLLRGEWLEDIPLEVWDESMDFLMSAMRAKTERIQRMRVSSKTAKWRRWAAETGYEVETYRGEFAGVIPGSRVGIRTGTLMQDLVLSRGPTVVRKIMKTGTGGSLIYAIDPEIFHASYPAIFSEYVKGRGIQGGIGLTEETGLRALDILSKNVTAYVDVNWRSAGKKGFVQRVKRFFRKGFFRKLFR